MHCQEKTGRRFKAEGRRKGRKSKKKGVWGLKSYKVESIRERENKGVRGLESGVRSQKNMEARGQHKLPSLDGRGWGRVNHPSSSYFE